MDDTTKSILAHCTLIGWIVALVMNQSEKGINTSFYLRQNLGFMLLGILGKMIGLVIPGIAWLVYILLLVLWGLSLISAMGGQRVLSPVIGIMFQAWFKRIS